MTRRTKTDYARGIADALEIVSEFVNEIERMRNDLTRRRIDLLRDGGVAAADRMIAMETSMSGQSRAAANIHIMLHALLSRAQEEEKT